MVNVFSSTDRDRNKTNQHINKGVMFWAAVSLDEIQ